MTFLIYSNTAGIPFIFDDASNIVENKHIRLTDLSLKGIADAGFGYGKIDRPFAFISFALNYYFHGYNVLGYHIVNILIHIITGILLFYFIKLLLEIHTTNNSNVWIAFFTAFLWAVNPVQTQSVTYIVQRMNSMSAMFYLLSFVIYIKASRCENLRKKWALFAGCFISGILAIGTKENAAMLPVFILLYAVLFQHIRIDSIKNNRLIFFVGVAIFIFIILIFLGTDPIHAILSTYKNRNFTLTERLMTQCRVVLFYLTLLLFPHPSRLNLAHDFPLSVSLVEPVTTIFCLAGIILSLIFSIVIAKKNPLLSFCILWYFGNLAIESTVIGLEIIFEHRLYLPSMLVLMIAVIAAFKYLKPKAASILLSCIILVCCFWTYQRNLVWQNEISLWNDCVKKSPKLSRAQNNFGLALEKAGRLDEAIIHYQEALKIEPAYEIPSINLGSALTKKSGYNEAIKHYAQAVQQVPNSANLLYNFGFALMQENKLSEAAIRFSEALNINPAHQMAHNSLGLLFAWQGRTTEAIYHYFEAIRIDPDFIPAYHNMGIVLMRIGKIKEAIIFFHHAYLIDPNNENSVRNLNGALSIKNMIDEALLNLERQINVESAATNPEQALEQLRAGKEAVLKAVEHYEQIMSTQRGYMPGQLKAENYHDINVVMEKYDAVVQFWESRKQS